MSSPTIHHAAPKSPSPAAAVPAQAPYPRRWYTLAVLCLSLLVIVVDTTIVNVAIPTLASSLGAGAGALAWIVDSYTLVFAALLLPAGTLGDRFGRHRALAAGMLVFGAGSLGAALSATAGQLIAARAVMGAGAALIMPATLALLTAVFTDPRERAKAIGLWSAVSGLGVAIGPTAGGWLLQHYSWSAIFAVNLPVVAAALIAGAFLVPASSAPRRPRIDVPGAVLAAAGLGSLTYAVIQAGESGWTSPATLLRFAVALVLLAAFGVTQVRGTDPMLDLSLFRDGRFTAAAVSVMVLFFGLAGSTFVLTQIYQFVLGYSPLEAGVRSLPGALALTVASPLGTRLAARSGIRTAMTAGLLAAAAGLGFFATASGGTGYLHYMIASMVLCAGIGLTMAPATQSVMSSLPPAKTGVGSAVGNTTRNLGTVLGVAVVGSIAATSYSGAMPQGPAGESIGAAAGISRQLPGPAAESLRDTAAAAFVHGADLGVLVTAAVVLVTALLAVRYLPGRR
ncbi:DHA2 family efflux MFS transporter permease subunit [Actinomadura darangshiensis]|uniref:DHA2 family efflux MFS transporter permease subunit n=1 Tax=Actinomadura darangshiensis TaxID=705336 RepID=A0A4R5BZH9_9ACTN|nr:DHA2 family efflux MFS transporter permease subunit [Actinomadura darangshiensis]TDD89864.1 DHA2 family efflux MFS transporter permease subunit [Actinomadura darangshiensis]